MRRLLCIIVALVSVCTVATASDFSFRNGITFGMTMEQVIAAEGTTPTAGGNDSCLYKGQKAAGREASVFYSFDNTGLCNVLVTFTATHTNENLFIDDYNAVENALIAKYGSPIAASGYQWHNNLFKDDTDSYGIAIAIGHLQILSRWNFDDYYIGHALMGDNYEISHAILYSTMKQQNKVDTSGI